MELDMELYRVFHTVAGSGSVSRAAEMLFISQPAVSKSIRRLEDAMGVTLFLRTSRGVQLTKEGEVFHEHVRRAMSELTLGRSVLERMKTNQHGTVRLSVSTTLCKHLLIPHLKPYLLQNPHIRFQIQNKSTTETLRLVSGGGADLGIVSQPFDTELFRYIPLTDIHDVFVAGPHYLATRGAETPFPGPNHALMLMEPDNVTRTYVDRYLMLNNLALKPEIEAGNMDILMEFAKLGLGITVLIREFIGKELKNKELVEIPATPPIPPRSAGIVCHKTLPPSLAATAFLEYLKSCFDGKTP